MTEPVNPIAVSDIFHRYSHLVIDDTDHNQSAIPEAVVAMLPEFKKAGVTHFFIEWDRQYQKKAESDSTLFLTVPSGLARIFYECKKNGIEPVLMDVPLKNPQAIAFWKGEHYAGGAYFPADAPPEYRKQHEPGRKIFAKERDAANQPMTDLIARYHPVKSVTMIGSGHTGGTRDFNELLAEKLHAPVVRLQAKPMPARDKTMVVMHQEVPANQSTDPPEFDLVIGIAPKVEKEAKIRTESAIQEMLIMSRSDKLHGEGFPEAIRHLREAHAYLDQKKFTLADGNIIEAQEILKSPRGGPYGQSLSDQLDIPEQYLSMRNQPDYVHENQYAFQSMERRAMADTSIGNAIIHNIPEEQRCVLPVAAAGLTEIGPYINICGHSHDTQVAPLSTPAMPKTEQKRGQTPKK